MLDARFADWTRVRRFTTWLSRIVIASAACVLLMLFPAGLRAADQFFDSNGVQIHYVVEGQGEPVLLIHGFAVSSTLQWGMPGIQSNLAKQYLVIAMDNRGHGRSGKPHDPTQYGTEMVEDAIRLLDHLQIKKAHVVGYSMGAFITLKLLTTHPDRLLTATLGGAGRSTALDQPFLEDLADSLERGKGFGPLMLRLNPPNRPKPTEQEMRGVNQFLSLMNDTKALAAVVRGGMRELAAVEDLSLMRNRVPTLALVGELDPLRPGVEELRPRLPYLKVVVLPGGDHIDTPSKPEFLRNLQAFLSAHGTPTSKERALAAPAR
jgi:pimeloyl-ACP methyl ester carboxylesterase